MRITFRDGAYIAIATFEEQVALRKAGFIWHPGEADCKTGPASCLACKLRLRKVWWTRRPEAAARLSAFADEFATKALADHLRAVEMSRATDSDAEIPVPKGLAYLGYQKAGIAYMSTREATLLGDEQGLGKTVQVLGVINHTPDIKNVLVVAPNTLRLNWFREAKKWLVPDGRKWNFYIVDSDDPIPANANFVIVHYQRISIGTKICHGPCGGEKRKEIQCNSCKGTGTGRAANICCPTCGGKKFVYCDVCKGRGRIPGRNIKIVHSLFERKWDLLAVDEAHFVKNPNSSRTKAVIGNPYKNTPGLVHQAKRRLLLTGTPLPNRPAELWPLLSVCAPVEFGNFKTFARRYCDAHQEFIGKTKKVWKVDGASNLEELQERMRATCLPGDTVVETEHGRITIGEIVSQRLHINVWSTDQLGRLSLKPVVAFSSRPHRDVLIKIRHAMGDLTCTPDHRVYTSEGEKRADQITAGDHLLAMWPEKTSKTLRQQSNSDKQYCLLTELRRKNQAKGTQESIQDSHDHHSQYPHQDVRGMRDQLHRQEPTYVPPEEVSQPFLQSEMDLRPLHETTKNRDLPSRVSHKNSSKTKRNKKTGTLTEGERKAIAINQGATVSPIRGGQKTLENEKRHRESRPDKTLTSIPGKRSSTPYSSRTTSTFQSTGETLSNFQRQSDRQQKRYLRRHLDRENHHRSGWTNPRLQEATHDGQRTRRIFENCRVHSVEVLELGYRRNIIKNSCKDRCNTVYDIEVADNHNFFANGVLVHNCLIRRLKKDVLKDLPPKLRQVIPLAPNERAKKIIAEELSIWEKRFGGEIEMVKETLTIAEESKDDSTYQTAVERLKYIQNVAFMEMAKVRHDVAVAKIPMVLEHLEGLFDEGVEKIVCFAHHHDVIKAIGERFKDKSVYLYGETKPDDKQKAIDTFQNDPKVALFIGGILAAGVGLTLTASSHVVFAELDWVPASVSQAEDRCHRIGQVNTVTVQHLVLDGSLDARMAQLLVEKQEIADRALDRRTDVMLQGLLPARPEAPAPPVPLWRKILLKESLIALAQRRDPETVGGHGFSQFDSAIGQKLATWNATYSDAQAALAEKIVFKYRRQLPDEVTRQLAFKEPDLKSSRPKPKKGEPELSILDRILT